jgi:type VI protein secretion system component Hcp
MKLIRPLVFACVLASATQAAVAGTFLFIPGVPGEATEIDFRLWIKALAMSVGVANKSCSGVTLTKLLDTSSPVLSAAALTGGVYPTMTLMVTTDTGDRRIPVLTYTMFNVTVAAVNASVGGGTSSVVESVSLQPSSLTMTYVPPTDDGSAGKPIEYTLACPNPKK